MKSIAKALFAGSLGFISWSAFCIEIQPIGTSSSEIAISISGEIKSGDDSKFAESVSLATNKNLAVGFINLNSTGGIVSAGAGMAKIIRNKQMSTRVKSGAVCASACFMLFAAGKERHAEQGAKIGVHSAVNQQLGETQDAKSVTIDMARFLSELDVPPIIIGKVVTTKPDKITWLTADDLKAMKVHRTGLINPNESYIEKVAPKTPQPKDEVSLQDQRKSRSLLVQSSAALRIGNKLEALELVEAASKINPYDIDTLSAYGYALYLNGRNEEARDKAMLAIQINPNFSNLYRVLALANAGLSDEAAAYDNLLKYYKSGTNKDLIISDIDQLIKSPDSGLHLKSAAMRAKAIIMK